MRHQPTVFMIENHHKLWEAITAMLEKQHVAIEYCATYESALRFVRSDAPGCVLVDARAPGMDAVALLNALSDCDTRIPLVVIFGANGGRAAEIAAAGAIESAFGALDRPRSARNIISHGELRRQLAGPASSGIERTDELTPRQREVMSLVVDGLSSKQIAQRLGIAHRTVEVHRANLMKKMHVNSTAELIRTVLCADREGFAEGRSKVLDA